MKKLTFEGVSDESLKNRLKEIEKIQTSLYPESREIEDELEKRKINRVIDSGVLSSVKWEGKVGKHDSVYLTPVRDKNDKFLSAVEKLYETWHHHYSIPLGQEATLYVNDSDVHISFEDNSLVKPFVAKHKIQVSFAAIDEDISKYESMVNALKELKNTL